MPLFRRKPEDPQIAEARAGFEPVAAAVDRAQRALLSAIPTPRDDGVPLAEALSAFMAAATEAAGHAGTWRAPALRQACLTAIEEAVVEAERLRLEPGSLGFEALNGRVGDVLHPLEVFAEIERALRRGQIPRLA